ncbi:MAG: hypothetical protein MZV65_53105 [Chromatiales bacterium]|nr:hypothetical protein [Chromatiales bacterium]
MRDVPVSVLHRVSSSCCLPACSPKKGMWMPQQIPDARREAAGAGLHRRPRRRSPT